METRTAPICTAAVVAAGCGFDSSNAAASTRSQPASTRSPSRRRRGRRELGRRDESHGSERGAPRPRAAAVRRPTGRDADSSSTWARSSSRRFRTPPLKADVKGSTCFEGLELREDDQGELDHTSGSTRSGLPRWRSESARSWEARPCPAPARGCMRRWGAAGLAHCDRRELVTGPRRFGYLADRYGSRGDPDHGACRRPSRARRTWTRSPNLVGERRRADRSSSRSSPPRSGRRSRARRAWRPRSRTHSKG